MKMLIASDIHGSPDRLAFFLKRVRCEKPDRVLLLGDLLYHGPRNLLPGGYAPREMPGMYAELMDCCRLTAVRGNCDAEIDLDILPFAMPESCIIDVDGLDIYVSHGHRIPASPVDGRMGGFQKGTVFLRGHTHVPRGETVDGYHFWNPGSLTIPKSGFAPSYAIYQDRTFTVLDVDGRTILSHTVGA